jgi:hypothetical protein
LAQRFYLMFNFQIEQNEKDETNRLRAFTNKRSH